MKTIIARAVTAAAITMGAGHGAQAQVNLQQPLTVDTSVTVGKLANGLTYYIRPNAKPADKVELRLVVKTGSVMENDNQQGLAHFMEHMEFNGLKHYPKNELVDYLQKIGVRFGADLNANTGWDRTYFMLPIPTDKPGNLEQGFQIVGDWAGGALITTDEVNAERHVILEELRMRNLNAQTRMMRQYLSPMLNGSRYADRTPSGLDSIVLHADPDRIREFYRDWYRPDLMAVIVVGDITKDKAKTLIEKYFGKLKNPEHEKARTYYRVAPYTAKKAMVVTDSEFTGYGISLLYPSGEQKTARTTGDFREGLIKSIFLQCLGRRFRDAAQKSDAPFSSAGFSLDGSLSGITLFNNNKELDISPTDESRIGASVKAATAVLSSAAAYGFTAGEVAVSEKAYLPALESAYKERNDVPSASFTDGYAEAFMKGAPLIGITSEYAYVKELLPGITAADINAYAKKALAVPENYFALLTAPAKNKAPLPGPAALTALTDAAFKQPATRPEEAAADTDLLDKQPVAGKILSETKDTELGTTTYTLSNGVQVTVKPTDFQKDQILMSGVKYGGSNLYGVEDKSNLTFLGSVIGTMGFGRHTPARLGDLLSGKQASVTTGMGDIADEAGGSSSVKDLETMLQLLYLKLTEPRKDTALLSGWYNKTEARLPLLKADPQNLFKDSLTKFIYNNDPLTPIVIPAQQDMDNINVDRVLAIYRERFGYADGFHFFFVGNIDTASLKPLIEKYIGGLPVKGVPPQYKDNGLRIVTGNRTFRFYKGKDNKSLLLDMYHGDVRYSAGLALRAEMLAQAMTIELLKTVREEKQWIYSGGISASVTKLPYGHYSVTAQMPCGPEHADSIFAELDREAESCKRNGVSQEDLDKVKKAVIEQYREGIKQNGTWLAELQQAYFRGSDKNNFLDFEKRVNAVTVEELKQTAVELLGNDRLEAAAFPEK